MLGWKWCNYILGVVISNMQCKVVGCELRKYQFQKIFLAVRRRWTLRCACVEFFEFFPSFWVLPEQQNILWPWPWLRASVNTHWYWLYLVFFHTINHMYALLGRFIGIVEFFPTNKTFCDLDLDFALQWTHTDIDFSLFFFLLQPVFLTLIVNISSFKVTFIFSALVFSVCCRFAIRSYCL